MKRVVLGPSLWLANANAPGTRRASYPRQRGNVETDICVVGGGLAGCATAFGLAVTGVRVLLIERDKIGSQGVAASLGILGQEPVASYLDYESTYGRRAARETWTLWRRAMLDAAALLRRLKVSCHLNVCDGLRMTGACHDAARLRRERAARKAVRFDAGWLEAERLRRETHVEGSVALRTRGDYQLDPYRACLGLARASAKRGALLYERSPALRIQPVATGVVVTTERGTIRANRVVVATGIPTPLFKSLSRHLKVVHTYAVSLPRLAAKTRAALLSPGLLMRDGDVPPHTLRWTHDHRLVFGGADQAPPPIRRREGVLVQRAGQLMYELSTIYPIISGIQPEHAWHREVASAADGLPIVGPHRNYPRHLFALGSGKSDITAAFLAARILCRTLRGESTAVDERLGFRR